MPPTGVQTPYGDAFRLAVLAVQVPLPTTPSKRRSPQDRPVGETLCTAITAASPPDVDEVDRRRWAEVSRAVIAPAVERAHARYQARAQELHGMARTCGSASVFTLILGCLIPLHSAALVATILGVAALVLARAPAELLRIDLRQVERAADHLGTELLVEGERRALPPASDRS